LAANGITTSVIPAHAGIHDSLCSPLPFFRACCAGYFLLLAQEKVTKEKGTSTAGFKRGRT